MTDPLSSLLGSKKKEEKPKAASSLLGETSGSTLDRLSGGLDTSLLDVSAALGGARRNVAPGGPQAHPFSERIAESTPVPVSTPAPSRPAPAAQSAVPRTVPAPAGPLGSSAGPLGSTAGPLSSAGGAAGAGGTFDGMLEGEKVAIAIKKCYLKLSNPLCEVPGRLLCTNYRLKFQNVKGGLREELRWMQDVHYFDVPMGTLEELKVDSKTTITGALEINLKITTKDCRMLHFLMSAEDECRDVLSAVSSFSHPGNPTLLFAVKYCEEVKKVMPAQERDGWDLYDPMQEYSRMGLDTDLISNPTCPWKVSGLNTKYGLCSTYPAVLAFPRRMQENEIRGVAQFRKRGRLPALSWCGGPELNYAAVFRCSQTTEGLMGQKSPEDEKHVKCIREGLKNPTNRDLLVIDLRPWKAAWANKAGGGGFEGYDNCNLVFGSIDNIHFVRDAWRAMITAVSNVIEGEVGSWMKDVANSCWYDYIGAIMNCARKIVVEIVQHKSNVMVHCSDGWDRTAQTSSLSMLCLDPHYRTQEGFLKLIQKEWCSFGHKFRTRMALGEAPTSEYSPVFVQWLESVYQVVMQNPNYYEFTPDILLRLSSEVSSNRYGTFLTDCERERLTTVRDHTLSLWSVLLSRSELPTWRNPDYQRYDRPIVPTVSQACFNIWEAYWFRFHSRSQKLQQACPPSRTAAAPAVSSPASDPLLANAALNPSNPLAPASSTAAAAPVVEEPPSKEKAADMDLFKPDEVVAASEKPKEKPKQFFQDDDDDEDVFAKPKK